LDVSQKGALKHQILGFFLSREEGEIVCCCEQINVDLQGLCERGDPLKHQLEIVGYVICGEVGRGMYIHNLGW